MTNIKDSLRVIISKEFYRGINAAINDNIHYTLINNVTVNVWDVLNRTLNNIHNLQT